MVIFVKNNTGYIYGIILVLGSLYFAAEMKFVGEVDCGRQQG